MSSDYWWLFFRENVGEFGFFNVTFLSLSTQLYIQFFSLLKYVYVSEAQKYTNYTEKYSKINVTAFLYAPWGPIVPNPDARVVDPAEPADSLHLVVDNLLLHT